MARLLLVFLVISRSRKFMEQLSSFAIVNWMSCFTRFILPSSRFASLMETTGDVVHVVIHKLGSGVVVFIFFFNGLYNHFNDHY